MRGSAKENKKTAAPSVNRIMVVLSLCVGGETVKQTVATILFVAFSRFTCLQHFEAQLKVKIYDFLVLPRSAFVEVCGGSVHHIQT